MKLKHLLMTNIQNNEDILKDCSCVVICLSVF